ncbi:hypothetical protein BDM02DRAFT_1973539 [Thelephora ganbajun]|uniref:Uncharacterized protein n=1 Tax=Thelephora ganbajun TaxID=370292 RepID=A0ACB6Z0C7_THEGA|nr:hypothetical protein BDM02DRAFT_1973539 [Thelephora ganbajun]
MWGIGMRDGGYEGGDRTGAQPGWTFRLGTLRRKTVGWEEEHRRQWVAELNERSLSLVVRKGTDDCMMGDLDLRRKRQLLVADNVEDDFAWTVLNCFEDPQILNIQIRTPYLVSFGDSRSPQSLHSFPFAHRRPTKRQDQHQRSSTFRSIDIARMTGSAHPIASSARRIFSLPPLPHHYSFASILTT